jgi:glycosyltransferase involved in cell wall biosynthesis
MRTGGAERVVVSLARGAAAAGHDVAVASAPGELADEVPGDAFPLPLVQRRPAKVLRAVHALRRALRVWRPDLVHCHNPTMAVVTALATFRGRRPRALVSVHGVPEQDWPATARLLRIAGLPTVACGPGVSTALQEQGYPPVTTIPNGIGPPPEPADRAALYREWGLAEQLKLAVAPGRLVAAKNHELAIRAVAKLPKAALAILGEGPLLSELESAARDAGVADRVVLAGLRRDARAIVGAADAVLLTSHAEGLPLTALEALVAGTPLVATSVRGLRELLEPGRAAVLVPPDDENALADALRVLFADPALARRVAEGGRAIAAEHTEERMASRYLALYGQLAAA